MGVDYQILGLGELKVSPSLIRSGIPAVSGAVLSTAETRIKIAVADCYNVMVGQRWNEYAKHEGDRH
jgi:hypothetical protein